MSEQALNRKYQAYPEYKDSGVEWLGTIPASWTVAALRHGMSDIKNGSTATQVDQGDETVPISRIETISTGKINTEKVGYVVLNNSICNYKLNIGDILFSHINSIPMVGNVAQYWSDTPLYHGMNLLRIQPSAGVDSRYLFWWLKSDFCRKSVSSLAKPAINQASIAIEQIKGLPCINPDLSEQKNIAAFLDYETARIDSLIDKQQRLIELLKEKRQAVISHAVTKGLNPAAPMKDSGVEWLGQVPEHWVVGPLKYRITSMDQGWSPQCEARLAEEGEFGVLKVGAVNGGIFKPMEHKALPSELEPKLRYRVTKGVLLISRANTRELVGSAAVVNDDYDNLLVCDKLYRLTLNQDTDAEFVALVLGVPAYREQIELSATGASDSMQNIGQGTIRELIIAMPSKQEAKVIVESVVLISEKYSRLIESACKQIVLLNERRTALISAAVTGKIDLREWVKPT
ncbi:restriction endonuclease subunit S [Shewanella chilikensis]|uniref:restriction endonuclease subunit S n=1 Tax=Shewanella chilikensis TaxID=558541 RepID=UPI00399B03A8